MTSDSGYVRLHRSLIGHPAFRNDSEAMAFAWMIARAAWRPVRVRYKGLSVPLQRGQLAISIRDFAEAMDRSKGWVERLFTRLKTETMVKTHSETGVNVVTICNYDLFQVEKQTGKTAGKTPDGTGPGQRQDTEQEREEGKKENNKPESRAHARPLPEDWAPEPFGPTTKSQKVIDGWPPGELDHQLEHFRAHHAKTGAKFVSWQDAWKTWVLNNRKFGNGNGNRTGDRPSGWVAARP
jgi:hypothetical protein